MAESVLCDISAAAIRTIRSNAALLQVEARCQIYKRDVFAMLDVFVQQGLRFDLVYIDPPYRLQRNDALLEALVTKGLLAEQADVIVESLREESFAVVARRSDPSQRKRLWHYEDHILQEVIMRKAVFPGSFDPVDARTSASDRARRAPL